ncbi:molybdopterin-dependent oxidoreductase [Pseudooceanicola sp. 216_PA32_1]|uniref:Molybdopterin-dependent oxidoreductase n=1 Tax=Pseudooceanicola pacificus TaxID=2676438 RepID=A0A844W930_9RHOB|nr:xanthine dehydrogenase family protein molybdopterin-binding subunit [Pseudooceanicola pacificus]MWB79374.1 molybdopterin-dependent oxidoreductase [Pseudooceanicola pacificus]
MTDIQSRPGTRREDLRLTTGRGRYVDDIAHPGALHAVFVRSEYPSARVMGIDISGAEALGATVLTASDLADDGVDPVVPPFRQYRPDGSEAHQTRRPLLVEDRVRFQGEPLAMVLAASLTQALDAAEAVQVELEELPPVMTLDEAKADGAPLVWDDREGNLIFHWAKGDGDAVMQALDTAAHVTRLRSRVSRVSANAMEPRGALAYADEAGRMTICVSHQSPFNYRASLAQTFAIPPESFRVMAPDVGGSFGMKSGPLREEMLVFWAARRLGRAVRWTATRSESLMSDEHARDLWADTALALDDAGNFLALHVRYEVNCGAYVSGRSNAPVGNFGGIAGVYRTPAILGECIGYVTNTQQTAPYRGAGRPDATYMIERIIDLAAFETGRDPAELRRKNLIPPSAMPYQTPFVFRYDSGEFERVLDRALELVEYAGFPERRAEAARRGRLRGIGLANPIEVASGPWARPSKDFATLRADPQGRITLLSGAMSVGQGLETALSAIAADRMGVDHATVDFVQGDTDARANGKGSGGSSALSLCGSAVTLGAAALIEAARAEAAAMFGTGVEDIAYDGGLLRVEGSNRVVGLGDLAKRAQEDGRQLEGAGEFSSQQATFPNGCHICEVEIDPETGQTEIVTYVSVEDVGTVMNPYLVAGQIHGGVVQGLGQVLFEEVAYDPGGQLLTGSFMDYAMPRAADLGPIVSDNVEVPTKLNLLGVKGVGEAGTVGGLAAGMNAVCHALQVRGIRHFDMPATPHCIWQALNRAG